MQGSAKSAISVSQSDMKCLKSLVRRYSAGEDALTNNLNRLQDALDSAAILESLPQTVVALGAEFMLRNMESGECSVYTLVLPHQANISGGTISILTPLGTAVLGRSVGDVVQFDAPGGARTFRLENILPQTTVQETTQT